MPFDWGKYQPASAAGAKAFDWSKYQAPAPDQTGAVESGALGLGQGATLGFGDELAGATGATLQNVLPESLGGGTDGKSWGDLYRENRDFARKLNDTAAAEHPIANTAGKVIGGIASSALVPGSGLGVGAARVGLGTAMKIGTGLGAVQGLGESTADLSNPSIDNLLQAAKDTSVGGAMGAGASLVGHGIGAGLERAGGAFKDFANKQALATLKGTAGDYSKILGRGQVDQLGDFLLKPQMGLEAPVSAGALPETVADNLEGVKAAAGAQLSHVLPQLDVAGQAAGVSAIDHQSITRNIMSLVRDAQAAGPKAQPIVDALTNDLSEFVQSVPANATFSEAEAIKRGYWAAAQKALAKLPRDRTAADDVSIKLGGIIKDSIEDQAEKAARTVGQPDLLHDFLQAKSAYGSSEQMLGIAGRAEGRAFARNLASPSDKLAAAAEYGNAKGAGNGDVGAGLKAMAASLINNQVRRRAAATLAVGADAISSRLQRMAMTSPGKLGAYGGILAGALQRGGQQAFNAHVFTLSQTDPKFQAMQQKLATEHDDD